MDEKFFNEAAENLSIIKGVIDRTSKSFISFSKIFICWGILFIVNSIINLTIISTWDNIVNTISSHRILYSILHPGIITLIAAFVYWYISKKKSLVGFEKYLMIIWVLVLIMNAIQPKISINTTAPTLDMTKIIVRTDNFSVILFGLAIALITTGFFAGYKHLRNLGIVYICISLIYIFFEFQMLYEAPIFQIIYFLPLPFTFLYTGFFLRTQQIRRN